MKAFFFKAATVLALFVSFSACETYQNEPDINIVAEDFNFATTKTVNLTVKVNDTFNSAYFYTVEVYDQHPFTTDTVVNKLAGGVAKQGVNLSSDIVIPQHLKTIFVCQTDPLARKTVRAVEISGDATSLTCDFGANVANVASAPSASKVVRQADMVLPRASDYALPATYTTLSNASVTLSGDNYYVPSGVTNSSIDFGWTAGAALYVAGTVNFNTRSAFYMAANTKLVVLPGGKVTFNISTGFEQSGIVVAIHGNGQLVFNESFALGDNTSMINDGTVSMKDEFEIRSNAVLTNNNVLNGEELKQTNNSTFRNYGTVNLSEELIMNSNTLFENNGTLNAVETIRTNNITSVIRNNNLITTAYFDMKNGGGTLQNNCKVLAEDMAFDVASITCATGTIIACQDFYANMTSFTLNGNAILKTSNQQASASSEVTSGVTFNYGVEINGVAVNSDKPLVSVWKLNRKNGWQVLTLKGNMEYALPASETPGANYFMSISNGVSFVESPTVSIASTSCNEGGVNADNGNGNPSGPTFPMVVTESNSYTFAMEDLWPNLGDYDMNDFVFSLKNIKKTINADNKVLRLEFDIVPRGAGSTKKLAAAVQFDNIQRSNISVNSTNSVAKIESDLSLANVRLFNDVHSLFGKSSPVIINTYERFAPVNTQTYTFTFDFATPVSANDVIVSALNFYVIVGDADVTNRKEIHLAGYKPTTKVTRETNNYKDANNMIWALMLPTADFKYPTESTKIFNAYSAFSSWAASAGKVDADWYLKPSATNGLVYTKY